MRDPNSSIGVGDWVGTLNHEKHAIHQTHFSGIGKKLKQSKDWQYEWEQVSPTRWIRVKKEKHGKS